MRVAAIIVCCALRPPSWRFFIASSSTYVPPDVWQPAPSGGAFANINRPVSGPTHEKVLPVGKHPLQLYSQGTPNGVKVTVMLEELLALRHTGAEYDAWLIRIGEGDQFSSGFVEVNPNSKIPALFDRSGETPVRVFESGSILLYLAEKFGAPLPRDAAARTEALNWLFWQMGRSDTAAQWGVKDQGKHLYRESKTFGKLALAKTWGTRRASELEEHGVPSDSDASQISV